MTSLTAIFGSSDDKDKGKEQDSEKLLDLYWNRAELKKEFAALREEKFQLADRVKHHQGATARVQQKYDHLENLLLDPEWVHNVVTHYQLRRLSMSCAGKIARFAEQLKQQREQRQQSAALVSWNEQRKQEAADVQARIGEVRMQVQLLEDRLQAERHRLVSMSGLLRLFRKRALTRELDDIAAEIESSYTQERELLEKLDQLQKLQPPDHQGLSVATKRSVNFMILAYAQQLFLHLVDDDLALLSKEASEKSVGAINYGGKDNCNYLLGKIAGKVASIDRLSDLPDVLRRRARLIAESASFRSDDDTVPISSSVATAFIIDGNAGVGKRDANLLGDNYWAISRVVSR